MEETGTLVVEIQTYLSPNVDNDLYGEISNKCSGILTCAPQSFLLSHALPCESSSSAPQATEQVGTPLGPLLGGYNFPADLCCFFCLFVYRVTFSDLWGIVAGYISHLYFHF